MATNEINTFTPQADKIYTGIVKWFNMDLRYGFVNILNTNINIFAHKNDINNNIRYKCLIKGEYVHFKIVNSDKGLKCENITGIDNNMLLCESNSDLLKKLILCQYIEKTNPNLSFIKMS
tara:strand:+ start:1607 stop:1966 length:360 start_codon:yes stop_codon:yes gene_type:complete